MGGRAGRPLSMYELHEGPGCVGVGPSTAWVSWKVNVLSIPPRPLIIVTCFFLFTIMYYSCMHRYRIYLWHMEAINPPSSLRSVISVNDVLKINLDTLKYSFGIWTDERRN